MNGRVNRLGSFDNVGHGLVARHEISVAVRIEGQIQRQSSGSIWR
jgi:hypothetical protein